MDGNLINLYRCIRYHCAELQRELRLEGSNILLNSRELFFDSKAQMETTGLTDIQRAARYFYIIRASYGADRKTFSCNKKAIEGPIDRQADFARMTGIRPNTISDLHHGAAERIGLDHLDRICEALDCTLQELIELQEAPMLRTGKALIWEPHGGRKKGIK